MKLKIKNKKTGLKIVFKMDDYILYNKESKIEIKDVLEGVNKVLDNIDRKERNK